MFRHKVAAATLGILMVVPMFASADTTTNAQIQTLLSQIKALQEQVKALIGGNSGGHMWQIGTTTPGTNNGEPCFMPGRRLGLGTQGEDVKGLQEMLKKDPKNGFNGRTTGFFGPHTQQAMKRFHERMGIGTSTDGSVGPRTQDFFKKHCDQREKNDGQDDGMMSHGQVSGTIKTHNSSSITVETTDGKNIVVNFATTTTVHIFTGSSTKPTVGGVSDLLVGKKVIADGRKNADGSINAKHIMVGDILPTMQMMMDHGKGMWADKGKNDHGKMMHNMMSGDDSENENGLGQ